MSAAWRGGAELMGTAAGSFARLLLCLYQIELFLAQLRHLLRRHFEPRRSSGRFVEIAGLIVVQAMLVLLNETQKLLVGAANDIWLLADIAGNIGARLPK